MRFIDRATEAINALGLDASRLRAMRLWHLAPQYQLESWDRLEFYRMWVAQKGCDAERPESRRALPIDFSKSSIREPISSTARDEWKQNPNIKRATTRTNTEQKISKPPGMKRR
jgi:hypothetical protein